MRADRDENDVQAAADALKLIEAFRQIHNPGVRRTVISLAQTPLPGSRIEPDTFSRVERAAFQQPRRAGHTSKRGAYASFSSHWTPRQWTSQQR